MKFSGPLESQRLSFLLEMAISREAQMWKVYVPKTPTDQDAAISPAQRDEVIQWLAKLKTQFHLYPETLALAISLLDRFLATVKKIPVLKVLARDSLCGCSPAEILRMERIVLDKLNWDLHTATPLDFLHLFHAIAVNVRPQLLAGLPRMSPSQHVAVLSRQLLQCMACYQLLQFKGSMMALAIISLEVEKLIPDWLALTIELLQKTEMDSSQLIHCRELVARHLSPLQASLPPNAVYVYSPLKHTLVACHRGAFNFQPSSVSGPSRGTAAGLYQRLTAPTGCKHASTKRKVEEMEVDDFYDGIKRLYNEDSAPEAVGMETGASGCSTDLARQEGSVSPCPPLQAVSVM
ncbi:cyclin-I isoform X2 [Rhinatrema bivittatum]|uniref:cyclin-I isoform X2 n=1 Tax=Rhinatrema bivittatum TaxID=194408 RepID=UPI00112AC7C3|nr:cyclin-I isoform X2 [Rhinatrema bivittatum]